MKQLIINKNDAENRLDKFISKAVPSLPPSLIYKYIRKKRIKVNHKKSEGSAKLKTGDIVELYINDEFFENHSSENNFKNLPTALDIIYEDENIILVNKKPGLIVHPDKNSKNDCLINRIKNYLFNKKEYNPESENSFSPSLVNRIDRNTSGIVIAAKNAETLRILNQKMKSREIHKSYLCIICGKPKNNTATLTAYLEKNHEQNKVYITKLKSNTKFNKDNLKTIITQYNVIESSKNFSLLEVNLLTGRTHQIRAHLSSIGHPILGDGKYGKNNINRMAKYKYQALCSYKLCFEFKSDAGILNYLNHKKFIIPNEKIWFINDFYTNLKSNNF